VEGHVVPVAEQQLGRHQAQAASAEPVIITRATCAF
jgi:hypothetical protein